jgi:hypothetical protein
LEDLVPPDHQVRIVWALVERPDLSGFYDAIRSRGASPCRSAKERVDRIERSLSTLPQLESGKEKVRREIASSKPKAVRASTTDAASRLMKQPDVGFRPGYNVQKSAETESRAFVVVEVTNSVVESGQAEPIRQEVE